ncbi:hypothetical protein [Treponema sp.]|uniref:hypothetical protein n=1 Tax=Treponema sp. TaxID=166 RepID=UPI00298DFD7F|nr:hypothetical protein [Treponema sp.]MCR5613149.1 hypothetical protein [Treponema sp.]
MSIVELKNIECEEGHIFYLRKYTADAVIELPTETSQIPVSFSIEMDPMGRKTVNVKIIRAPNYPVLPILAELKKYIIASDKEGRLPQ